MAVKKTTVSGSKTKAVPAENIGVKKKNLSEYKADAVPEGKDLTIGIVVSEWNNEITDKLLDGAVKTLKKYKVRAERIKVKRVPGTFELTLGAQYFLQYGQVDAVIALGCVVQGETRHFDFICQGVTQGITDLNIKFGLPVIFGVLTTNTMKQAQERAGGQHGNKGDEAAITALKMANLHNEFVLAETMLEGADGELEDYSRYLSEDPLDDAEYLDDDMDYFDDDQDY